ncbi:crossover junction endodeoxyribonuclease RuvC [Virgibacillus dakarensis]|nr:crossover junction endodeoxyribonuclease RuvC [Virgibacillus dakarensis]
MPSKLRSRKTKTTQEPTIMGIDPSLANSGIAIANFKKEIIKLHTITTEPNPLQDRIYYISNTLEELIEEYNVHLILFENNYTGGSKEVNWVIGNIYRIAANKGIEIVTYSPATIKKAVTGYGRANKKEMKPHIHRIFGKFRTNEHVRDALGVIHCYFEKEVDKK